MGRGTAAVAAAGVVADFVVAVVDEGQPVVVAAAASGDRWIIEVAMAERACAETAGGSGSPSSEHCAGDAAGVAEGPVSMALSVGGERRWWYGSFRWRN